MKERFIEAIFPHQALIYKICRLYRENKEDREDLFQEIVYQLWKAYPSYEGRSKITTWMYRIGLNTAIAVYRKKKIMQQPLSGAEENMYEENHINENEERLKVIVNELDDADRAIITLYFDELSYEEIADIVGISENYVGVRLNRIKKKIKNRLIP